MPSLRTTTLAAAAALLAVASPVAAESAPVTPDAALARLMDGNKRFVTGQSKHPHQDAARRTEVAKGQQPFAMLLSCADSRVPPEVLFDQGLGDLFVVRLAGNVEEPVALGSLEFGAAVLGARLLVVLGHEYCGAVKAALEGASVPGHVQAVVDEIVPAVRDSRGKPDALNHAMAANVRATVADIPKKSSILAGMQQKGELKIVGAAYDLDTGAVTLVDGTAGTGTSE